MPNVFDTFGGPSGDVPGGLPGSRVGVAETFPRILASGAFTPTTAHWNATAIYLPAGLIVRGATFFAQTALGTGTHQWFGLWDKNLALVIGSADDTSTAWATGTAKRLAFTAATRLTYTGLYYVGIEISVSAGNVPSLASLGTAVGVGPLRALTPAATVLDTSTADTAIAPTLTQVASTTASSPALYAVLD